MSDEEEKGALPGGLNLMLHVMGKRWSLTGERDDQALEGASQEPGPAIGAQCKKKNIQNQPK